MKHPKDRPSLAAWVRTLSNSALLAAIRNNAAAIEWQKTITPDRVARRVAECGEAERYREALAAELAVRLLSTRLGLVC